MQGAIPWSYYWAVVRLGLRSIRGSNARHAHDLGHWPLAIGSICILQFCFDQSRGDGGAYDGGSDSN